MTVNELKSQLEGLGFSPLAHLRGYLYPTVNRALGIIESEHPTCEVTELPFFPERVRGVSRIIRESSGAQVETTGGTVSFKVQGKGSYRVFVGEKSTVYSFSTLCREVSLDLPEGGRVEFLDDGRYTVFDLSVTAPLPSPLAEATERIGGGYAVDLSVLYPHFLYLLHEATDKLNRPVRGVRMLGGKRLFIPDGFSGTLILRYRRGRERLDPNGTDNAEIDVPEELEPLLTLLCAYYLWLDDEDDKAEKYYEQYKELSDRLKSERSAANGASYIIQNGW